MDEKTLIRISFITVVIGLSFLFLYAQDFSLRTVENLDSIPSTEQVHLKGTVNNLRETDNAVFLQLEGEKVVNTDVILFPEDNIYLHEGDEVEIYGQVEDYNGEKEVVGDKVVLK